MRALRSLAVALVISLAPSAALAQADQARALFQGGAAMYDKAHYLAAIEAFRAAYERDPRPGILFSIAQAHRKQFFFDKNPMHLGEALKTYRAYVDQVKTGGRRAEAIAAIAELEPYTTRFDMAKAAASQEKEKRETRIMVQGSAPNLEVRVDDKPAADETLHWTVTPGKHVVRASAAGFAPQQREVTVREGDYESVLFDLKELPAHLTIDTLSGATVSIDGRLAGTTPLPRALDVDPGVHVVTVTTNGHRAWTEEIDFARGSSQTLHVALPRTGQRVAAYVVLGASAVTLIVGGTFAVIAGVAHVNASNLHADYENQTATSPFSSSSLADYHDARDLNASMRQNAIITLAAGVTGALVGTGLYLFDTPGASGPAKGAERVKPSPLKIHGPRELEMSFAPIVAPQLQGGAVTVTF